MRLIGKMSKIYSVITSESDVTKASVFERCDVYTGGVFSASVF